LLALYPLSSLALDSLYITVFALYYSPGFSPIIKTRRVHNRL
jgi:hypothetical protein